MKPLNSEAAVSKPRAFITLDMLRGVAAVPVVYLHTFRLFGLSLFPHGSLAVDFFFLLSGFVMTYVYQERLDSGWSTQEFLRTRVLRLYPLYFLGLVAGILFLLLQNAFGKVHTSFTLLAVLALLNLAFLPSPPFPLLASAPVSLYPFNVPSWSLFYELAANAIHAFLFRRRTLFFILVIVVAFSAVMLWLALRVQVVAFGPDRAEYMYGLCRVLFSYPLGIVLYRLWSAGKLRFRMHPLLTSVLLLSFLSAPVPSNLSGAYEWLVISFAFPLLLLAGASTQTAKRFVPVSQGLGAVSYPLYILHVPFFEFFEQSWIHIMKHRIEQDAPWPGLVFLAILFPAAFWLGELYDPEARKLIHKRLWPLAGSS